MKLRVGMIDEDRAKGAYGSGRVAGEQGLDCRELHPLMV